MYKIEIGYPLPGKSPMWKSYPFDEMVISTGTDGDCSFFIPAESSVEASKQQSNVHTAKHKYRQTKKATFNITTKRIEGGVRVWRIA